MEQKPDSKKAKIDSLKQSSILTKSVKRFTILLIIYLVFIPLDVASAIIPNDSLASTLILSVLSLSPLYYHCLILSIYKYIKGDIKLTK